MRINYKILWFEDDKSSYRIKKDFVKNIVEDFGFYFEEPRNEVNGDNIDNIDFPYYDLIIADMTLANGATAMNLLSRLRTDNQVFTEILFYSSEGENAVRSELANYKIDGAYCSGRDNDDFEYKAREVIRTLIKKTQDLTNLRGLVMAETSQLDKLMEEIIHKYYVENVTSSSNVSYEKIINDIERDHKTKLNPALQDCKKKCTLKLRNKSKEDVINSLEFDSSRKARAINKIIESLPFNYDAYKANFYEDYTSDIIQVRNNLAHSHSEIRDGIEVLITKKANREIMIFNDDFFKNIRRCILKYTDILNELKNSI